MCKVESAKHLINSCEGIVSYRIVSYRIVSYRIVSYRIVSYRIVSYRIVSYRIVSYRIQLNRYLMVMNGLIQIYINSKNVDVCTAKHIIYSQMNLE